MSRLILVPLESVPTRYTHYWETHLPKMLKDYVTDEVIVVSVDMPVSEATPGAFLNFGVTNLFKSKQAQIISQMFLDNEVLDGDVFFFADAWNPVITQVRYMIDLLGVKAKIASIWHAGSYDPQDFLGRLIENKKWTYSLEKSMFECCDINFFATNFHKDMFESTVLLARSKKSVVSGLPMEYIKDVCKNNKEKHLITFPHRLSVEKNYQLFKDIAELLPQYEFFVCQEHNLSKAEYYDVLSRTKILFSANTQETLGIGVFEGMASGAFPLVPNGLSYKEMYNPLYRYNPIYIENKYRFANLITGIMESPINQTMISVDSEKVYRNYFTGEVMYKQLKQLLGN